ncbi:TRAP transporter substrate-binding protein [Martelella mediterranea]|uniref:Tripartite ATP-independent transporter DctP family solute receptor n=1 Tax=Martelella mediterranea TaxID=293089 RepID=A0A4R3NY71_9HYPH|nr:TRAP transporter substrate-binding protein [Martelella mediterranea]TCT45126.1 tripartite ATP-independent transporter DctP family solute receptor [Martelella mediterranea]
MKVLTKLALVSGAAAVAFAASAEARTLRLNHNNPPDHPLHASMQYMGERLSELTDGRWDIQVFPNGQLGNQRESMELVQSCALDMAKSNASELEAFAPAYSALNLPYLFVNEDHLFDVLTGDIGTEILDSSYDKGFQGIGFFVEGARSFYGNKPIYTPEDLQGMKIRVQPSPSAIRMVELLGGSPTPIAWGELYSALQQGVVDGAENNPTAMTTARHGEVAKHFSLDEHTMIPSAVVISNCAWDQMSDEDKAAFHEAAVDAAGFHREAWDKIVEQAMVDMQEQLGVEVNEVDKAPFVEAVQPMYEEITSKSPVIADLVERIQEEGKNYGGQ